MTKPMRITFILPGTLISGGVRVVATYMDRLRRRGHIVHVIAVRSSKQTLVSKLKHRVRRGEWPNPPATRSPHLQRLGIEPTWVDKPIDPNAVPDADVVIATWWATAHHVAVLPPSKGAKVYFIQHHEVFLSQSLDRVHATYRMPMHKIVISQWLVDQMRECYGVTDATLVPNSCDLDLFDAPPRGKQKTPTVGYVYNAHPTKGCDLTHAAIEQLRSRLDELRVVSFGVSAPTAALPAPTGVDVRVLPDQSAIRELYASADVWLCSSRAEGFGLPLLEAMACRTPVIATPAGAAPQLIEQGGGVLVPHDDATALADAAERIVRMDEPAWRAMSEQAHATAHGYSWDDASERFEAALRQAIERARLGQIAGGLNSA